MGEQPMLERIARVLCEQELRDPDAICIGEGKAVGRTWLGWQAFSSSARTVLTAMREPTPTVLAALSVSGNKDGDDATPQIDIADRWRALIDAELADGERKGIKLS